MVFYKFYRFCKNSIGKKSTVCSILRFIFVHSIVNKESNDTNWIFHVLTSKINYKMNSVASRRIVEESTHSYMLILIYFRSYALHIKFILRAYSHQAKAKKKSKNKPKRSNNKQQTLKKIFAFAFACVLSV